MLLLEQVKSQFADQKVIAALINDIEKHDHLNDEATVRNIEYLSDWL